MLFCIIKTNLSLKYLVSLLISKTVSYTHSCCLYYIGTTAYYIAIKNVNLQFTELSYPVDLTWFIWSPVSRVLNHPASIAYSTWGWIHLEMPPKNRGRPGFDLTGILHLYCTALLSSFYARDLHIILWMPTMSRLHWISRQFFHKLVLMSLSYIFSSTYLEIPLLHNPLHLLRRKSHWTWVQRRSTAVTVAGEIPLEIHHSVSSALWSLGILFWTSPLTWNQTWARQLLSPPGIFHLSSPLLMP